MPFQQCVCVFNVAVWEVLPQTEWKEVDSLGITDCVAVYVCTEVPPHPSPTPPPPQLQLQTVTRRAVNHCSVRSYKKSKVCSP